MNVKSIVKALMVQLNGLSRTTLAFGTLFVTLTACGTETGNPVTKRPTTPRNVAQDSVESDLFELSESLAEHGTTSSALTLLSDPPPLSLAEAVACTGDAYKATTTFEKNKEVKKDFAKRGRSVLLSLERKLKTEWNSPNGGLACNGSILKRTARLMAGSTEIRTGTVKRVMSRTSNSSGNSAADYSSATFQSSGEWKNSVVSIESLTDSIVISRTSEWTLKKSQYLSTSEGESSTESTSGTVAGSPLKIKIFRGTGATGTKTRTIESGSTKTNRSDGSSVEITFDSVVFSEFDSCYPSKGKVRGLVTPAPSSGLQPESFEIDFSNTSGELPEIVFTDGQKTALSGACLEQN